MDSGNVVGAAGFELGLLVIADEDILGMQVAVGNGNVPMIRLQISDPFGAQAQRDVARRNAALR